MPTVLTCPNCRAPLHVESGQTQTLCKFCGAQVQLDDHPPASARRPPEKGRRPRPAEVTPINVELTGEDLKMLSSLSVLCSSDPQRPAMQGILLAAGGRLCATDGHAMAVRKSNRLAELKRSVILGNCRKIPAAAQGRLVIGADEAVLRHPGGEETLTVIHETFPDYRRILPEKWKHSMRVKTSDFARLLEGIEPHLESRHPARDGFEYTPVVELSVDPVHLKLSLATGKNTGYRPIDQEAPPQPDPSPDWRQVAEAGCTVLKDPSSKTMPVLRLNCTLLRHAMAALDPAPDETIELRIIDDTSPLGIFSASDPERLAVVMPIYR